MVSFYWFKFEPNTKITYDFFCKNVVKMLWTYHFKKNCGAEIEGKKKWQIDLWQWHC